MSQYEQKPLTVKNEQTLQLRGTTDNGGTCTLDFSLLANRPRLTVFSKNKEGENMPVIGATISWAELKMLLEDIFPIYKAEGVQASKLEFTKQVKRDDGSFDRIPALILKVGIVDEVLTLKINGNGTHDCTFPITMYNWSGLIIAGKPISKQLSSVLFTIGHFKAVLDILKSGSANHTKERTLGAKPTVDYDDL